MRLSHLFFLAVLTSPLATKPSFAGASDKLGNPADSKPTVTSAQVNGFQVQLVDIRKGGAAAYGFLVPFGTADRFPLHADKGDNPAYWKMGIAHLFEHLYSRGSLDYPGHDTLNEAMARFGFQRNASTGLDFTVYHGTGPDDHLLKAMRMHLAGLRGVELESDSVIRERRTVIDAVVDTSPSNPQRAMLFLPFMTLLPDGHPLKGYLLGDRATLNGTEAASLRSLQQQIYHGANVKMVVIGNFSSGRLSVESVLEELKNSLPAENQFTPPSFSPAPTPTLFSSSMVKVLEIDHPAHQTAQIMFDLGSAKNLKSIKRFLTLLSGKDRGGLLDFLRQRKGWVESFGGDTSRVGSRGLALVRVELTDLGFQNREEVLSIILGAIDHLRTHPFANWQIERQKQSEIHDGQRTEQSVGGLLSGFRTWLGSSDFASERKLDWRAAAAEITPESMQAAAARLSSSPIVRIYMGRFHFANGGAPQQIDPIFRLPYRVTMSSREIQGFDFAKLEPTVLTLGLIAPSEKPPVRDQNLIESRGWIEAYIADRAWDGRSLSVEFTFPELTAIDRVSLAVWRNAFLRDHSPELAKIQSEHGVEISFEIENDKLRLEASGKNGFEVSALIWALRTMAAYHPKSKKLETLRQQFELVMKQDELDHPALVAKDILMDILSESAILHHEEKLALADISAESIAELRKKMQASNKRLTMAGRFNNSELGGLRLAARGFSPDLLPTDKKDRRRAVVINQSFHHKESWQDQQRPGYGIGLMIPSPSLSDLRRAAAFAVARPIIHQQVFSAARAYGYVQAAAMFIIDEDTAHLGIFGQTESIDNVPAVQGIWRDALNAWKSGRLPLSHIDEVRRAEVKRRRLPMIDSTTALLSLEASLKLWGKPDLQLALARQIEALTAQEILEIVGDWLTFQEASLSVQKGGSVTSCEKILNSRRETRGKILGNPE